MYLWALRGRPLCKAAQDCFCQGNSIYAQHTVISLRYNNFFPSRKHSIINSTNSVAQRMPTIPMAQTSPVVPNKYNSCTTTFEQSFSSASENQNVTEPPKLSNKDKLKRAVKDYGATVFVFHITISLMSLGLSYLVISSGVDVASLFEKVGFSSTNDIATGASMFVVAYALHKMFAPVRISITLGCTPFIVRYLRRVGILKAPKSTGP